MPPFLAGVGKVLLSSPHILWITLCPSAQLALQVIDLKQFTRPCQQMRRPAEGGDLFQKPLSKQQGYAISFPLTLWTCHAQLH